jgi:hypothetical protein
VFGSGPAWSVSSRGSDPGAARRAGGGGVSVAALRDLDQGRYRQAADRTRSHGEGLSAGADRRGWCQRGRPQLRADRLGTLPNAQHDLGTDLLVQARDARLFDRGLVVGVQAKGGPSYFEQRAQRRTVHVTAKRWSPPARAPRSWSRSARRSTLRTSKRCSPPAACAAGAPPGRTAPKHGIGTVIGPEQAVALLAQDRRARARRPDMGPIPDDNDGRVTILPDLRSLKPSSSVA